jgi:hypothetical protein
MARFYFHFHDHRWVVDEEGVELPDVAVVGVLRFGDIVSGEE